MNRKNTILIAVVINAGLLAVLLVAALTMQEDLPIESSIAKEAPIELQLPKFDDVPVYQEIVALPLPETIKPVEESEPIHKLPPFALESTPLPPPVATPPVTVAKPILAPIPIDEIVVKKGDSLEKIARNNHTTVDAIIKANHLPSSFLKIGQVLKIPKDRSSPVVSEKKELHVPSEYHTMKVGENPWAIAKKHHMKVEELLKLNGLNEEKARKLKPGDRLRIR